MQVKSARTPCSAHAATDSATFELLAVQNAAQLSASAEG
jgi:hypothetical protein